MGNTFKLGNYVNGIFQDSSNNIGIGAAPSGTYKLEVTGTAKVSSTLLVSGASTLTGNVVIGANLLSWYSGGYTALQIGGMAGILSNTSNTSITGGLTLGYNIYVDSAGNYQYMNTTSARAGSIMVMEGGNISFQNAVAATSANPTLTTRMTITSGGNVGIGRTPTALFDVYATSAAEQILQQNTASSYARFTVANNSTGTLELIMRGSTGAGSLSQTGSGDIISRNAAMTLSTQGAFPIVFGTDSTTRMTITSAGSVQINGPVYRYNGQTVVGGSFTNLTAIDLSSSRTYLIQMIPTNVEAAVSYRIFGVIQANATSASYTFVSLASQTMDITFSGTTVQARVTNSQQWTFNWSITQLL